MVPDYLAAVAARIKIMSNNQDGVGITIAQRIVNNRVVPGNIGGRRKLDERRSQCIGTSTQNLKFAAIDLQIIRHHHIICRDRAAGRNVARTD